MTGSDADSDKLTYEITTRPAKGSLDGTAPNVTYTPNSDYAGPDSFTFKVNDGTVDSAPATVSITVTGVNEKPIANAGADQDDVEAGEVVSLDGSGSTDADSGDTLTYLWTFTDKPTESTTTLDDATSDKPSFTADKVGTYTLSLTVNDDTEDSDADSVTITTIEASTSSTLKKTGQTAVYQANDDGTYQTGVAHSYTRKVDDTVTDNVTGLIWQDNEDVKTKTMHWLTDDNYNDCANNGNNCENTASDPGDPADDTATEYCASLTLGGYSDWRLPTSVELEGIVDYGKASPSIDTWYFQNTSSNSYWSSTTYKDRSNYAWCVAFGNGGVYDYHKDGNRFVRCVRAGE